MTVAQRITITITVTTQFLAVLVAYIRVNGGAHMVSCSGVRALRLTHGHVEDFSVGLLGLGLLRGQHEVEMLSESKFWNQGGVVWC
jgi:hypothetical protein